MSARTRLLVLLAVCAVGLAACTAGVNPDAGTPAPETGDVAGFWFGLWHGVIAPITFVISLFTDGINIYEVHNSGNWYDAGFMLGLTISLGGGGAGGAAGRR